MMKSGGNNNNNNNSSNNKGHRKIKQGKIDTNSKEYEFRMPETPATGSKNNKQANNHGKGIFIGSEMALTVNDVYDPDEYIISLERNIKFLTRSNEEKNRKIGILEKTIINKDEIANALKKEMEITKNKVSTLQTELTDKNKEFRMLEKRWGMVKVEIKTTQSKIMSLNFTLKKKREQITKLDDELERQKGYSDSLRKLIEENNIKYNDLLNKNDIQIMQLKSIITAQDNMVTDLKTKLTQTHNFKKEEINIFQQEFGELYEGDNPDNDNHEFHKKIMQREMQYRKFGLQFRQQEEMLLKKEIEIKTYVKEIEGKVKEIQKLKINLEKQKEKFQEQTVIYENRELKVKEEIVKKNREVSAASNQLLALNFRMEQKTSKMNKAQLEVENLKAQIENIHSTNKEVLGKLRKKLQSYKESKLSDEFTSLDPEVEQELNASREEFSKNVDLFVEEFSIMKIKEEMDQQNYDDSSKGMGFQTMPVFAATENFNFNTNTNNTNNNESSTLDGNKNTPSIRNNDHQATTATTATTTTTNTNTDTDTDINANTCNLLLKKEPTFKERTYAKAVESKKKLFNQKWEKKAAEQSKLWKDLRTALLVFTSTFRNTLRHITCPGCDSFMIVPHFMVPCGHILCRNCTHVADDSRYKRCPKCSNSFTCIISNDSITKAFSKFQYHMAQLQRADKILEIIGGLELSDLISQVNLKEIDYETPRIKSVTKLTTLINKRNTELAIHRRNKEKNLFYDNTKEKITTLSTAAQDANKNGEDFYILATNSSNNQNGTSNNPPNTNNQLIAPEV